MLSSTTMLQRINNYLKAVDELNRGKSRSRERRRSVQGAVVAPPGATQGGSRRSGRMSLTRLVPSLSRSNSEYTDTGNTRRLFRRTSSMPKIGKTLTRGSSIATKNPIFNVETTTSRDKVAIASQDGQKMYLDRDSVHGSERTDDMADESEYGNFRPRHRLKHSESADWLQGATDFVNNGVDTHSDGGSTVSLSSTQGESSSSSESESSGNSSNSSLLEPTTDDLHNVFGKTKRDENGLVRSGSFSPELIETVRPILAKIRDSKPTASSSRVRHSKSHNNNSSSRVDEASNLQEMDVSPKPPRETTSAEALEIQDTEVPRTVTATMSLSNLRVGMHSLVRIPAPKVAMNNTIQIIRKLPAPKMVTSALPLAPRNEVSTRDEQTTNMGKGSQVDMSGALRSNESIAEDQGSVMKKELGHENQDIVEINQVVSVNEALVADNNASALEEDSVGFGNFNDLGGDSRSEDGELLQGTNMVALDDFEKETIAAAFASERAEIETNIDTSANPAGVNSLASEEKDLLEQNLSTDVDSESLNEVDEVNANHTTVEAVNEVDDEIANHTKVEAVNEVDEVNANHTKVEAVNEVDDEIANHTKVEAVNEVHEEITNDTNVEAVNEVDDEITNDISVEAANDLEVDAVIDVQVERTNENDVETEVMSIDMLRKSSEGNHQTQEAPGPASTPAHILGSTKHEGDVPSDRSEGDSVVEVSDDDESGDVILADVFTDAPSAAALVAPLSFRLEKQGSELSNFLEEEAASSAAQEDSDSEDDLLLEMTDIPPPPPEDEESDWQTEWEEWWEWYSDACDLFQGGDHENWATRVDVPPHICEVTADPRENTSWMPRTSEIERFDAFFQQLGDSDEEEELPRQVRFRSHHSFVAAPHALEDCWPSDAESASDEDEDEIMARYRMELEADEWEEQSDYDEEPRGNVRRSLLALPGFSSFMRRAASAVGSVTEQLALPSPIPLNRAARPQAALVNPRGSQASSSSFSSSAPTESPRGSLSDDESSEGISGDEEASESDGSYFSLTLNDDLESQQSDLEVSDLYDYDE